MYKEAFITAREAIRQCVRFGRYQSYWCKSVLVTAWCHLFPHLKNQLKRLYLKKEVLYISLDSLILTNDLRQKTTTVLTKLKEEISALGEDPNLVEDIVFL